MAPLAIAMMFFLIIENDNFREVNQAGSGFVNTARAFRSANAKTARALGLRVNEWPECRHTRNLNAPLRRCAMKIPGSSGRIALPPQIGKCDDP
jgi:hypothetical protein